MPGPRNAREPFRHNENRPISPHRDGPRLSMIADTPVPPRQDTPPGAAGPPHRRPASAQGDQNEAGEHDGRAEEPFTNALLAEDGVAEDDAE